MDIVGSPAATAGLGNDQGNLVGIVFSGLDGVDELSDDQNGGVTGVIVDVFLSGVDHGTTGIFQHIHLIALPAENTHQHGKVIGEHLGNQEGIFFFHLFCKKKPAGLVVY